jgi:hypothetical protein
MDLWPIWVARTWEAPRGSLPGSHSLSTSTPFVTEPMDWASWEAEGLTSYPDLIRRLEAHRAPGSMVLGPYYILWMERVLIFSLRHCTLFNGDCLQRACEPGSRAA